jgi:DNA-binding FrmR family transcriptional regulator
MIEDRQYCVDIMTQLRAARSALKTVEMGVLETHMHACLAEACHAKEPLRNRRVSEIMALLKKYD